MPCGFLYIFGGVAPKPPGYFWTKNGFWAGCDKIRARLVRALVEL
jgi:hypothetical protein